MEGLRGLKDTLRSASYVEGRAKAVVSGGGESVLTTTSHTLLDHLHFRDPVALYVGAAVKALPDFGLYAATLAASFLVQPPTDHSFPFLPDVHSLLLLARRPLDLSLSGLRPFVTTVLSSKPLLDPASLDALSLQVVKAALFALSPPDRVGHLIVDTSSGPDTFLALPGLLYRLECEWGCGRELGDETVLLVSESILDVEAEWLVGVCAAASVTLVACQKVVGRGVQMALREAGVLWVERLGLELARGLSLLLDTPPLPSCATPLVDVSPFVGAASVKRLSLATKPYLLFESTRGGVSTLFASSRTLFGADELRRLIQQSVASALSLLATPFVVPGGGFLEVWMCRELSLRCCPSPALDAFKRALLATTPHSSHTFFTTRQYMSEGGRLLSDAPTWDSFALKRNALMTALEIIVNVLNIGHLVSD